MSESPYKTIPLSELSVERLEEYSKDLRAGFPKVARSLMWRYPVASAVCVYAFGALGAVIAVAAMPIVFKKMLSMLWESHQVDMELTHRTYVPGEGTKSQNALAGQPQGGIRRDQLAGVRRDPPTDHPNFR